ncbi:uncharacterized protein LACBIDRAFT_318253 [Laccaria bicolor S238N-H82]|uniref:Predicted protein n=1 Tax=Laccaria bicolor (strain S238N-H82 / ATCC MYA-4686) TaxID=486041 RepID=B0D6A8_LACBS|nr:uncharacterized protein LACBIDRAFT_318253 [Laccaria bicolor S238N-H82]EDR09914.1 predicted protein [Laccaria bicolor S238N-H82]|eukprot:XP_001879299.1 predicted protein [Laccaria bicolor S238N-H82]
MNSRCRSSCLPRLIYIRLPSTQIFRHHSDSLSPHLGIPQYICWLLAIGSNIVTCEVMSLWSLYHTCEVRALENTTRRWLHLRRHGTGTQRHH